MKKIISALTLGAMVACAAFADVSINLNYRQRALLYTQYDLPGVTGHEKGSNAFYVDKYNGNGSDNLAISLSGDIVSFDMQWVSDQSATAKWRAKGLNATVFLGPVTLYGGLWADGKLNGAYRAKQLCDATNFEGIDFEWKKLGSAYANAPDNFVDNLVAPVGVNLPEKYAIGASYKVPGISNGALALDLTMITNEESNKSNGALNDTTPMGKHTFAFRADGRVDGLGQGELVVKYGEYGKKKTGDKESVNAIAAGLYVQPAIDRALVLTVGGSLGMVDGNLEDIAAELRAHYVVTPNKFTITSFHHFSMLTDAENGKADYGISNKTSRGIADYSNTEAYQGLGGKELFYRDQIISNNLAVRYFVTPKLAVVATVADMIGMGDNMGQDAGDAVVQLRASAWAQIFADANNSVNIGFVYAVHNITEAKDAAGNETKKGTTMGIPVILRVKL